MKVLQVLPELNSGGVERGTLEIAEHLVQQGHEAVVVSFGGRLVKQLEDLGAQHIAMPVHKKSLTSLFQVIPFRKLLEREKPDILHIRSRVPGWIAYLAWRGMDPINRPRLVSTVHGFYSVNAYSAVMTWGEQVIAVSSSIKKYILINYPKCPEDKITIIHRGVSPPDYPFNYQPSHDWLEDWKIKQSHLVGKILFLLPGRITRLKGHKDFFELVHGLRQKGYPIHGLIVGDAHPKKQDYLIELQNVLSKMNLESHMTFLGHRKDVREIMAVSNLVCALSQQPESFGRTVLEALKIGKPVLGYDCGGVGELLSIAFPLGRVPLGDSHILLEKALIILDEKPYPQVPEGAFTLDAMCASTLALYHKILK